MSKIDSPKTVRRVTSIRGTLFAGASTCVLLLGGFSAWSFSVPLSGAIIAQGTVITDGSVQVVRHERGGILATLAIREGEAVRKGTVLATLTRAEDRASAEELKARVASLTVKQARLAAEQKGKDRFDATLESSVDVQGALFTQLVADQEEEFASRRKQLADTVQVLSAQRDGLAEQSKGIEGELHALEEQRRSLDKDIALRREGVAKGLGRENVLRELERQADGVTGGIVKAEASIAALSHQIAETENRIAAERSAFLQKVSDELSRVRAERIEALEALSGKADAVARIEVRSPVDGVVNKLHVNTVGSAVEPFAPLFEIVANDQPLLIEAKVSPGDIDDVYPGQMAQTVLSAFNRRLYDPVDAKVTFVAADARQESADQPAYYTIRLSVDEAERARLPEIVPGMPSEVYLVTHERTFADYIAEPFIQSFQRAFRE